MLVLVSLFTSFVFVVQLKFPLQGINKVISHLIYTGQGLVLYILQHVIVDDLGGWMVGPLLPSSCLSLSPVLIPNTFHKEVDIFV